MTHEQWENGTYKTYIEWMKDTIRIHREYGLTRDQFEAIISAAEYNNGVYETFKQIDRGIYVPIMVTGGFRELTARAQLDHRIEHCFAACEYLFGDNEDLVGWNLLPCDFAGKKDFIDLTLRDYGLSESDWLFVCDGRNDIPVAEVAPISVGYRPHAELAAEVDYVIHEFSELLQIFTNLN